MKTKQILSLSLVVLFAAAIIFSSFRQTAQNEPWTKDQLMAPADLASIINNPKAKQPIIFSIGPSAIIKNSIDIGMASKPENLQKFKDELSKLPRNADIVIYCGCCPFVHCPNVRPAFSLLNEMKFTNQKLLNLSKNIKSDWIEKGYPKNE